jgi:hypothetical protein
MYATSSVRAVIIKTSNVVLDHKYKDYLQEEKQTKKNKNPQYTFKKQKLQIYTGHFSYLTTLFSVGSLGL